MSGDYESCEYLGCSGRYTEEEGSKCEDCGRYCLSDAEVSDVYNYYKQAVKEFDRLERWIRDTIPKLTTVGYVGNRGVVLCLICDNTWLVGQKEYHGKSCIARRLKEQALNGWSQEHDADGQRVCHHCGGQISSSGFDCLDCGAEWS